MLILRGEVSRNVLDSEYKAAKPDSQKCAKIFSSQIKTPKPFMTKIYRILTILIFVGLQLSASAEEGLCPIEKKNQTLLEQNERYLNEHSVDSYGFGMDPPMLPIPMAPVSDTILLDQDFLTAPIFNADDLLRATKQANDLASKGQPMLAKKIQDRITDASNRLYGRAATSKQLSCISVAERLRKTAWKLELREPSSSPSSRVEESYRGIVEVFQHEFGDSPLTANALGDLARVWTHREKPRRLKPTTNELFRFTRRTRILQTLISAQFWNNIAISCKDIINRLPLMRLLSLQSQPGGQFMLSRINSSGKAHQICPARFVGAGIRLTCYGICF